MAGPAAEPGPAAEHSRRATVDGANVASFQRKRLQPIRGKSLQAVGARRRLYTGRR